MDFKKTAEGILKYVGGEKNVDNVYHCATRLRFTLRDNKKADKAAVENVEGVISVVEAGGMFQVVIGNNVNKVYAELVENTNLGTTDDTNEETKEKKGPINAFLDMIAGVFAPTLGVLSGSGLIKGVLALLTSLNLLSADSGTYIVLNAAADAFFYFLPIFLAYTAAKKFKTDTFIAMALGAALVYPTIVSAYSDGLSLTFTGIPIILAKYTSTVIPAIIAVWVLSHVERFFRKRLHESIRNLLTPFFSLIIMVPLTILVVGPVSNYASELLADGYMFLYNLSPIISSAIVGGLWQVFVIFGLHWGLVPVMNNNISFYGRDTIGPSCMMAVSAQAGAALGVFFRTKEGKLKTLSLSAFVTGLFGITEPAIYGVTLKYKKPFVIACCVSAVFGGIAGAAGAAAFSVTTRSILSFPVYIGQGFIWVVIGYFASMIISCVLTYLFGYKDDNAEVVKPSVITKKEIVLEVPAAGQVINLKDVKDETFSSGVLGDGFAVIPSQGMVYSPINGTVDSVFSTKHAINIIGDNGEQILIHIGIDTVELKGKYFESAVKNGDKVKAGALLSVIDIDEIKSAGYDPTVIVIVANGDEFSDIKVNEMLVSQINSNK